MILRSSCASIAGATASTFLIAYVAAVSGGVNAADPPAKAARDCRGIDDYKAMVACYEEDARETNAEMTRLYEGVLKKIEGADQRDLLSRSQDAWIAYRTAYCSFESSAVEGGSIQPTIRNICHADITRGRIKELEFQLNCREGVVGCVAPNR